MQHADSTIQAIGPIPAGVSPADVGRLYCGDGGAWQAVALACGGGLYLSALIPLGGAGVCLTAPVWTCPAVAVRAAENAARLAAE